MRSGRFVCHSVRRITAQVMSRLIRKSLVLNPGSLLVDILTLAEVYCNIITMLLYGRLKKYIMYFLRTCVYTLCSEKTLHFVFLHNF